MKKNKSKIAISTLLALQTLYGCSSAEYNENQDYPERAGQYNMNEEEQLEKKTFDPYEHIFWKRYHIFVDNQGQIIIPEGYEILNIVDYNKYYEMASGTGGFVVFFINNKPVEVTPVYNDYIDDYDYSEPGIVIEKETTNETEKTLIK